MTADKWGSFLGGRHETYLTDNQPRRLAELAKSLLDDCGSIVVFHDGSNDHYKIEIARSKK